MRLVQLPFTTESPDGLRRKLWLEHRIDVPVNALAGGLWVRISAQIYNDMDDYRRLARAITAL
jgi:isopenicillin-N epimerase